MLRLWVSTQRTLGTEQLGVAYAGGASQDE